MEPWESRWKKKRDRPLGQGGKGTTFLVYEEPNPDELFALKVLKGDQQGVSKSRAYFWQEIDALVRLDHPALPRIVDDNRADLADKSVPLFFVATYFDGSSLDKLMARKPPSIQDAVVCTNELCAILDYCHRMGVVHRDVKPDNVIAVGDDWSKPVLVDFGLSFVKDQEVPRPYETAPRDRLGNAFFRLPEYQSGAAPEVKRLPVSDVTMTAALFLHLLSGVIPRTLDDGSGVPPHLREAILRGLHEAGPGVARFMPVFEAAFKSSTADRVQLALRFRDLVAGSPVVHASPNIAALYHDLERLGYPATGAPPIPEDLTAAANDMEAYREDLHGYAHWIFLPTVRLAVDRVTGILGFSSRGLALNQREEGSDANWVVDFEVHSKGNEAIQASVEIEIGHRFNRGLFFAGLAGRRGQLAQFWGSIPEVGFMSNCIEKWLLEQVIAKVSAAHPHSE